MGGGASKGKATTDAQPTNSGTTEGPAAATGAIVVAAENPAPPSNTEDLLASCVSSDPLLSQDPLPSGPVEQQSKPQAEQQPEGNEAANTQDKPEEALVPPEEEGADKLTPTEGERKEGLDKPRSLKSTRGADFSGSEDEYEVVDGEDGLGASSRTVTTDMTNTGVLPVPGPAPLLHTLDTRPFSRRRPSSVSRSTRGSQAHSARRWSRMH